MKGEVSIHSLSVRDLHQLAYELHHSVGSVDPCAGDDAMSFLNLEDLYQDFAMEKFTPANQVLAFCHFLESLRHGT
jgi:hypothetical protein